MTVFWNSVKTTFFLGLLTGLFLFVGAALGGRTGMLVAGLFAVAFNMAAWYWSDKIALRFSRARAVSEAEEPDLHRMVSVLAQRAGIPKPAVYLVESESPNAFATGRSPAKGAVAVTTVLQRLLTREELAGVVAHEIAHIRNRDTLISSIAASIAGAVSMIADMAMWSLIFGGGDEEEGGGGLVALIVAPIAALLVQMAISRSREYVADASGARLLGTAEPLVRALEKLEAGVARRPMQVNPATSHMYIVNPLLGGLGGLFRTHPHTEKRIAALRALPLASEAAPQPLLA